MADMKIPRSLPAPSVRAGPGGRTDAARSAQAAFFQAAMTGAQAPKPEAKPAKAKETPSASSGDRLLRPGSRVDIKV